MKNIFKLLSLFLVLAVFTNCQKDDLLEPDGRHFGPNLSPVRYLYGEEAKEAAERLRQSAIAKKINIKGLNGEKSDGWDIDLDRILLVTDPRGSETFTYNLTHPDMSNNQFFNLVHTEHAAMGTVIQIVTYTMSSSFADLYHAGNADVSDFAGSITFDPVQDNGPIFPGTKPKPNPEPEEPTPPGEIQCPRKYTVGVGPDYPPGGSGGGPANPDISIAAGNGNGSGVIRWPDYSYSGRCISWVRVVCSENTVGHYGGNGGACTANVKGYTYMINNCTGTTTQVKSNGGQAGQLTGPCNPFDMGIIFPELAIEANCKELNDLSQKTPFNDKMNELKTKAGTQNFESAYVMYDVGGANGISFSNEFKGSTSNPEVAINLTSPTQPASNSTVVVHCHLDNIPTYKVLTFDDIIVLGEICKASTKPGTKLGVYVTTAAGNFAIKPTNRVELRNKLDLFNMTHDSYIKDFKEYLETTNTTEQQILGLLNFIKDRIGEIIDLYQQKPNGTWQRLSLSSNGKSIVRTDC